MTAPATATLSDFLLARIADDEASVNDRTRHLSPDGWSYLEQFGDFGDDERWMIEIPAARVLAECEAKRRLVEQFSDVGWSGPLRRLVLEHLALPYSDHPEYLREWRL